MNQDDIRTRRRQLDKERQARVSAVVDAFYREHRPEWESLMLACGKIGHLWRFTHFGPTGKPWSTCAACGKSTTEYEG